MGTPKAAAVNLERLIADGHEVSAVYTQPDRPSGRGKRLHFSPVKEVAIDRDLNLMQPTRVKTDEAAEIFRSHDADVAVVVAYGRILPRAFLEAFPRGALNVHFSLLPKYRGAAPVNWAIVNGEIETGVTVMQMDEGLDTGDMLLQRSTEIGPEETSIELMDRLAVLGAGAISEALSNIDRLSPIAQNDAEASFAPIMKKEDGLIDWRMDAHEISRRVRGFQPFPSTFTFHAGLRLTIWRASPVPEVSEVEALPGTIIKSGASVLYVASGNGSALAVSEIQPEGKKRMPVRDFLNGSKIRVGDILSS